MAARMRAKSFDEETFGNRQMFIRILENIRYFARQGLPMQGDDEDNGNFIQLLKSNGRFDKRVSTCLERKKYTTQSVQTECLTIITQSVVREIAERIKNEGLYYSIIVDEIGTTSNKSQFTLCLRWVDDDFEGQENFVGLYEVDKITPLIVYNSIKECLRQLDLPLDKCRGQCYDGTGIMMEARIAVADRIKHEEPRAMFTHCYGHSLQFAVADAAKSIKLIRNSMDVTNEVGELLKQPTKRDATFRKIKDEIAPETDGFRTLCPSRCAVRAASFQSVIDNWMILHQLWEELLEMDVDAGVRGRVIGAQAQMKMFDHLFGIFLGTLVMKHSDNLSRTLQRYMSSTDGQAVSQLTVKTIGKMRNEDTFLWFWRKCIQKAAELNIGEPTLPGMQTDRQTKCQEEVEDYFREIYHQSIDAVTGCIQERLSQKDYTDVYKNMEDLLINAVTSAVDDNALNTVINFYGDDFEEFNLKTQLELLPSLLTDARNVDLISIRCALKDLPPGQRAHFDEIVKLVRLILVAPPTNMVSQESATTLKRVKNYLKNTASEERVSHALILSTYKEKVDSLKLSDVANLFCEGNEQRLDVFGVFSEDDVPVFYQDSDDATTQTE